MSRRDEFVSLLNIFLLKTPIHALTSMTVMVEALKIPDYAFPSDLQTNDVIAFARYVEDQSRPPPKWLVEHRENEKVNADRVTIAINVEEHDGPDTRDEWWMNAEALAEPLPKSCMPIVCDRVDSVKVSRSDAARFFEWAREVPGWSEDCPPFRVVEPKS